MGTYAIGHYARQARCIREAQDKQRDAMAHAAEYNRRVEANGKGLRKKPAIALYREISAFWGEHRTELRRVKYGSWAIDIYYDDGGPRTSLYSRVEWESMRRYYFDAEG